MSKPNPEIGATGSVERVCLGAVAGAHGMHGGVRMIPFTAEPEAIGDYGDLITEDGARTFGVTVVRRLPRGQILVQLVGVDNRTTAEGLKGTKLFVPRDSLPPTGEGEYYHADLIGMTACTTDRIPFGIVAAVHNFGGGDMLEIAIVSGSSIMIPFTPDAVPDIDIEGGTAIINPPQGLLEEEA